jgi:beta-N-acetylhexosaminidase
VAAAVAGIQSAGVAACAKHFPGHGDTTVDSHVGLPTVGPDLAGALEPFRAAVAAGVLTVMTGHLLVPGYGDLPATLNPALIDGLLRREFGFDGVVVSDALEMGAIAGTVGIGAGAVLAMLAGVDALCLGGDEAGEPIADVARDALVAAVRSGQLPEERLAAAAGRVRALAGRLRIVPAVARQVEKVGLAAARRAVRCAGRVALAGGAPVVVQLDPAPTIAVGRTGWGLGGLLPGASELRVGPGDALPELPADRPLVVVARDATRVGWVGRAVAGLIADRPDAVVVEMGLPGPIPPARGWIATGGASAAGARAAAELLLGTAP